MEERLPSEVDCVLFVQTMEIVSASLSGSVPAAKHVRLLDVVGLVGEILVDEMDGERFVKVLEEEALSVPLLESVTVTKHRMTSVGEEDKDESSKDAPVPNVVLVESFIQTYAPLND